MPVAAEPVDWLGAGKEAGIMEPSAHLDTLGISHMGMIGCFASLSPDALQRLRDEPDLIEDYLYPDDGDGEPPNYIDLDKAWHGVHYLLTGQAYGGQEPEALAVVGGEEFGPEVGYGPARFLTSEQVTKVASALSALTPEILGSRFNPEDMEAKEIYPSTIWVRDGKEGLSYVLDGYQQLQVFYRDAASRGEAVIQWIA
jgi:hypothetical protein